VWLKWQRACLASLEPWSSNPDEKKEIEREEGREEGRVR
jgi:hypothetical protein